MEVEDRLLLLGLQPMVAREERVVLVDLAEALAPVVELAFGDLQPGDEAALRDLGLVGPSADKIDDGIAGVVGNPGAV